MGGQWSYNRLSPTQPTAAEAKDGTPVASGEDWFKVAAFIHLSPEAYQRVMTALDREASNE